MKYNKIIFVCTSNTSRSVIAEAIYKSLESSNDIEVISRGLVVLFPEPLNPKAAIVMDNHHLPVKEHTSVLLKPEDITEDTLLFTMNHQQKDKLMEEYGLELNVFTLKEFLGEPGDVLDPYGKTLVEYEECYIELARLIKKAVYKLYNDIDKEYEKEE